MLANTVEGLPLEGIRVITLTVVWAGPFAEMFFSDWGAEVIRVESIQHLMSTTRGNVARPPAVAIRNAAPQASYKDNEAGERPWNRMARFNYHARNKLGCTIDLAQPKGTEVFKQLIAKSDVFIENNAAGVCDRLGIGWSVLKEVNPRLVMVSLPGYGNYGPYRNFRGFGTHQEAMSGHTWLRGYPDLDPSSNTVVYHADACAGTKAALAVMLALRQRRKTGRGQFIDLAQTEAAISHQADAVLDYTLNGRVRRTVGNRHPSAAPCGAYRCKGEDEWVAITVFDDLDWAAFCRVLGNPKWTQDEKFSSSVNRWKNQDELDKLVESWTSQRGDYEIMYALQKEGVAAGPVISSKRAFDDPQLNARQHFEELDQVDCGKYLTPSFLWRAKNTPNKIQRPAVRLGEHNEYVYKEILGVSDEEYAQLEKEGHIGMDYAPHVK